MFRIIACSQRVGKQQPAENNNNNNNREPGLSAERQGSFSGRRAATHQGHAAVIPQEEMLESQILETGCVAGDIRGEEVCSPPVLHRGFLGGGGWRWLASAGSVDLTKERKNVSIRWDVFHCSFEDFFFSIFL